MVDGATVLVAVDTLVDAWSQAQCAAQTWRRGPARPCPALCALRCHPPSSSVPRRFSFLPFYILIAAGAKGLTRTLVTPAACAEWHAAGRLIARTVAPNIAAVPVHRPIGVNVTRRVSMSAQEVRRRFQSPLLRPVADFAEVWFREANRITFHNPLAAATIFDEHVCRFERGAVEVEVEDQMRRGATYWRPHEAGPHEVAVTVDADRFFIHYFSVVEAANQR